MNVYLYLQQEAAKIITDTVNASKRKKEPTYGNHCAALKKCESIDSVLQNDKARLKNADVRDT